MERPKVGTGVWVRKNGRVLLGTREGAVGNGTWCPPGGHLEMNETMIDCAIRETKEESGIEIANVRFLTALDNIWEAHSSHSVVLFFVADWSAGEPVPQEGEMHSWQWFEWGKLPSPLFRPTELFLDLGINPTL